MSTESAPPLGTLFVPVPEGVKVSLSGRKVVVKGPHATLSRDFPSEALELKPGANQVVLTLRLPPERKKAKALLHTWERHLGNLISGVTKGFEAKLKSVAAHFPMKLSVKEGRLLIENFLGEKHPRSAAILVGVEASVEGEFVVLRGPDIELVGQCAATIERATRIRDYDPRVFQDGIYLVERAHPKEA
ncbi:MAG: 50S ribosomal protein L6 [Thermoplasmata archaeon]|nr:50S ribosomal protein L6 [Thermoplasmata archaeon]